MTEIRLRFYGHIAGGGTFSMGAEFYKDSVATTPRGEATLQGDTVPAWSPWSEPFLPVSFGRIQVPWSSALINSGEIRIHGRDDKANDVVDARVYAVELKIEYERGWGEREASDETWSQTDPRVN